MYINGTMFSLDTNFEYVNSHANINHVHKKSLHSTLYCHNLQFSFASITKLFCIRNLGRIFKSLENKKLSLKGIDEYSIGAIYKTWLILVDLVQVLSLEYF